jgi:hypothetical protein
MLSRVQRGAPIQPVAAGSAHGVRSCRTPPTVWATGMKKQVNCANVRGDAPGTSPRSRRYLLEIAGLRTGGYNAALVLVSDDRVVGHDWPCARARTAEAHEVSKRRPREDSKFVGRKQRNVLRRADVNIGPRSRTIKPPLQTAVAKHTRTNRDRADARRERRNTLRDCAVRAAPRINEPHARGRRVRLTGSLGVWGVPSTKYVVRPRKHAK